MPLNVFSLAFIICPWRIRGINMAQYHWFRIVIQLFPQWVPRTGQLSVLPGSSTKSSDWSTQTFSVIQRHLNRMSSLCVLKIPALSHQLDCQSLLFFLHFSYGPESTFPHVQVITHKLHTLDAPTCQLQVALAELILFFDKSGDLWHWHSCFPERQKVMLVIPTRLLWG